MICSVSVERGNGIARLRLSGEMDMAAARPFRDEVSMLEREGAHLLVDLDGLSFRDSSGLHALVGLDGRGLKSGRAGVCRGPSHRMSKRCGPGRRGDVSTRKRGARLLPCCKEND